MSKHITLPAVDEFIRSGKSRLPPDLREAFETDRDRIQANHANAIITRMVIGYNALLPVDIILAPHTFWLSAFLHLGMLTPYMIAVSFLTRRRSQWLVRDGLSALFPVLMVGQAMLIFTLNCRGASAPASWQYQYIALAAIIFTSINQPLDIRVSMAAAAASSLIYLTALFASPAPFAIKFMGTALLITICYLSFEAKLRLESNAKNNFLRRLRDRMQRFEAQTEASRDSLTGLSNRRHFDERVAGLWATRMTDAQPVGIIMIDIDHFKLYNDEYGHPAGDHCIKRVGSAITAALRKPDDLAVRFGGEEFVLLLPGTSIQGGVMIAERVRRAVEAMDIPHAASPTSAVVTVSLGVTAGPTTLSPDALLAMADQALYRAKHAGRNQVHPPFMTLEPTPTTAWRATG
jgi:diguanylate cyclase (GGDEF)-like protein